MIKVALADRTHVGDVVDANYTPMSVGYIAAYSQEHLRGDIDVRLFFRQNLAQSQRRFTTQNGDHHDNMNMNSKRLERCRNSNELLILGTGNFGKIVLHGLKNNNLSVKSFIDLNPRHIGESIFGVPIISMNDIAKDAHVILASNRSNIPFLTKLLNKSGVKSFDNCDFLFEHYDFTGLETDWSLQRCQEEMQLFLLLTNDRNKNTKQLSLKSLDVVLTEKCTLKCVDCSNLMQYYKKPITAEHELLVHYLKQFMITIDYVHELRLIGGEPLMYRKIDEIIHLLLGYKNFGKIVIFTNGTIIPRDKVLEICTDPRVHFIISNYGSSLSKNANKLADTLSKSKISYLNESVTTWQDCSIIGKQERSTEETFDVFSNCCVKDNLTLLHDKIFGCPFSAHTDRLEAIPEFRDDIIDLNVVHGESLKEEIAKLISGNRYYGACEYCNGRDYTVSTVPAAVQTNLVLEYVNLR